MTTNYITVQSVGSKENFLLDKCISILVFLYISLSFTNQFIKIGSIAVFIYIFLIYLVVRFLKGGFSIFVTLKKSEKDTGYYLFVFFCFVWIIYSFAYALFLNNEYAWRFLLYLFMDSLGLCYVFSDCYRSRMIRKGFFWGIIVGITANLVVAIWEFTTGGHIMGLTEDYIRRFANIPLGFFVNANDLSTILIIGIVSVFLSFLKDRFINLPILVVFTSLTIIIVCATQSIIGIASLICMPIIALIHYHLSKKKKNMMVFLFSFIGSLGILYLLSFQEYYGFIIKTVKDFDETTFTDRFYLYDKTWMLFKNSDYIGIGPGQNSVIGVGSVHNFLLEIISEYGFFFGLIVIVYYLLVTLKQIIRDSPFVNSYFFSFCLILIPLSICSSSITKIFPIWPILGYMLSYSELSISQKKVSLNDSDSSTNLSDLKEHV